ncbi:excinuclease ABC subunit UvrC [Candidatus Deianiraea vastatrix]|uniref:UvrABC system protein C n=1 Tax=Candidatus Deianiraea vastatrix TaxID=2163644 RepID=A0A5B8XC46_9RICK|nr:excinuclease ABC subunit UvrC [Candidatus Deianiraea vastatrix]QED22840.1 UvrABC system protein C [Candidatus Deianiraea vastatrix]
MSEVLKEKIKTAPNLPGIYIMLSENSDVLYVGKAKNIQNRLEQYLNPSHVRTQKMVSQISDIRFITTNSEEEALMLEMSNVKSMKPKYNVLLKDDKSFPEIFISTGEDFPSISKHRGKRIEKGEYFGPFASSDDVYKTIDAIEKFFQIRTCSNFEFKTRSRPCMKYQIKRCTAPCVQKTSAQEYKTQIKSAISFLHGKNDELKTQLCKKMQEYSRDMEFEKAAQIRDTISSISKIQMSDNIQILETDNMDILGVHEQSGKLCIHLFFIRNGYNFGSKPYFFEIREFDKSEILYQFIHQFYLSSKPPEYIILSENVNYNNELSKILSTKIIAPKDSRLEKIVSFANQNAKNSLEQQNATSGINETFMTQIAALFNLSKTPERIEVFDNSHIFGKQAIGAMVSINKDGFDKSNYRKYNFDMNVNTMNDYEMMENMLYRRACKILEMREKKQDNIPDLWLIDGGVGHLSAVKKALLAANLDIDYICISKGVDRNAGNELFHTKYEQNIQIDRKSEVMFYLQRIRDEVHRFAITSHRKKRDKDTIKSVLDEIPNIGVKRKKALLLHFGSPQLVKQASISDLQKVEGVSEAVAKTIYDFFHD